MTGDTRRFKKLKRVFIGMDEETVCETRVTRVAVEHRGVRLGLDSIPDRSAAEKIVGSILFVDEKDAIPPPKGAFFIHDLIGLSVVEEDGTPVGVLKDVLKVSANDIYVVENEGKEILLPAVKEFIKKIDVKAGTMSVRLIEGMIDERVNDDAD